MPLFLEQELLNSKQPVRPGEPGKKPFWNRVQARQFVYAPAFDFPSLANAAKYQFRLYCEDGTLHTFTADQPWRPLSPIWDKVLPGSVKLTVEAMDENDRVIGIAGDIVFYRSPVFNGPYHDPAPVPYLQAAKNGLRAAFLQPKIQHWLTDGKPDPMFTLYCYPAKEIGAGIRGMLAYSRIAESPAEAQEAAQIARVMADFLLSISVPQGNAMEHVPPVYWINPEIDLTQPPWNKQLFHLKKADEKRNVVILNSVTLAGFAYLDLYDESGEPKYLQAARRIADACARTQCDNGTWPLLMKVETGAAVGSNQSAPTSILIFLDRLERQYGITDYKSVRERALRWVFENPMHTYNWEAQFEDVDPRQPYSNLGFEKATEMAYYLLTHKDESPEWVELAEELLRFVEDQFVVWERPVESWKLTVGNRYPWRTIDYWITPGVIEQYCSNDLVTRAAVWVAKAYLKAFAVTGKQVYFEKARSLGNAIIVCQRHHGGKEIPTFPYTKKNPLWLNNSMYTALCLLELNDAYAGKFATVW